MSTEPIEHTDSDYESRLTSASGPQYFVKKCAQTARQQTWSLKNLQPPEMMWR